MLNLKIKTFSEIREKRARVYCQSFVPLQEGSPTMLYAGGGTGKTYASIRMAIEYSLETNRKSALWLTEDTAGETKYRFDAICNEFYPNYINKIEALVKLIDSPPVKFTKPDHAGVMISPELTEIRTILKDFGMIVIDPLIQFNGGDENSNSHAGVMMGEIKTWASEELKVLVLIHHLTITDGGVKARGAGEWNNACRAVYLVGKGSTENCLSFKLTKNNGIAWCFRDNGGSLERELEIFPPWQTSKDSNLPF